MQLFCQLWILQSPVCQTQAKKSDSFGAAGSCLMEMVFCTPVGLPQSWKNNTAAGCVKASMRINNPNFFWVVHCSQQADSAAGALIPMRGGHIFFPLDDFLPPPAVDVIDNIREELDDHAKKQHLNPRSFPTTTGFQKSKWRLQLRMIKQQWYLELIRKHALCLIPDYKQCVVADKDVAWLSEYDHIVNPPFGRSLANWKCTTIHPAGN